MSGREMVYEIFVFIPPGINMLHEIPLLMYEAAVLRVRPKRPCLEAVYAAPVFVVSHGIENRGERDKPAMPPRKDANEPMLRILPFIDCDRKCEMASLVIMKGPVRFTARTLFHSSGEHSSTASNLSIMKSAPFL